MLAWYVVQVRTNMEDKVQQMLVNVIMQRMHLYIDNQDEEKLITWKKAFAIPHDMNDDESIEQFLKANVVIVPKEKVEEVRDGRKREMDRKIFIGYILIFMDYNDDIGIMIRKTHGVNGFIGVAKNSTPVPISQYEVDRILLQVSSSKEKAKYRIEFEVGERVRVIDGPFIDFNGTIEEVMYAKNKLKVNVQIFGRDTIVELEFGQVQKSS